MKNISTNLSIQFQNRDAFTPFSVVVDEKDKNSSPVHVFPMIVSSRTMPDEYYEVYLPNALLFKKPGVRRIRVYCSEKNSRDIEVTIDGGIEGSHLHFMSVNAAENYSLPGQIEWPESETLLFCESAATCSQFESKKKEPVGINKARYIGRVKDKIIESISFAKASKARLQHWYDEPEIKILSETLFIDHEGNEADTPKYDISTGYFVASKEVYGSIIIEYEPEYSLYEIKYGTGEDICSEDYFNQLKLAWLRHKIDDATVPPVTVVVTSKYHGAVLNIERKFYPTGSWLPADSSCDQFDCEEKEVCREVKYKCIQDQENPEGYRIDEVVVMIKKEINCKFKEGTGNAGRNVPWCQGKVKIEKFEENDPYFLECPDAEEKIKMYLSRMKEEGKERPECKEEEK